MTEISIDHVALAFTTGAAIVAAFWGIFMLWINSRLKDFKEDIIEIKTDHKELRKELYDHLLGEV